MKKFTKIKAIFKSLSNFSKKELIEKSEIISWLDKMEVKNFTINDDMIVDVKGDVILSKKELLYIPIKFGIVYGDFLIESNFLKNLIGCPKKVMGVFSCNRNRLISLEGCPDFVGKDFYCCENKLESLNFCPIEVKSSFYCNNNKLKTLKADKAYIVGGYFNCSSNLLETLEGSPNKIMGSFLCSNNKLKTLKHTPEYIQKNLYLEENDITDFLTFPKFVGENCYFPYNEELLNFLDVGITESNKQKAKNTKSLEISFQALSKVLLNNKLKQNLKKNINTKNRKI